jgi:hypothetical protein
MRQSEADREETLQYLRSVYPKGSVVYTSIRKVAPSGMSRIINTHAVVEVTRTTTTKTGKTRRVKRPEIIWTTGRVANLLGITRTDDPEGMRVRGCGMDMGFSVAYDLAVVLWGDGYALEH